MAFITALCQKAMAFIAISWIVIAIIIATFIIACIQHMCLYNYIIPTLEHERPVHFDYSGNYYYTTPGANTHSTASSSNHHHQNIVKVNSQQASHLNQLPASVSLLSKQWSHHTLTTELYNQQYSQTAILTSYQAYHIYLTMTIPDSSHNHKQGVVQVMAEIHDQLGNSLASSSRPIPIKFSSGLIALLHRTIFAIPYVLGLMTEKQSLSVMLFEEFVEHPTYRAAAVNLTLSKPLHVYDAKLKFIIQLKGIRYLLYHWFIASMTVFVCMSMFFQLTFISIVALYIKLKCFSSSDKEAEEEDEIPQYKPARRFSFPRVYSSNPPSNSASGSASPARSTSSSSPARSISSASPARSAVSSSSSATSSSFMKSPLNAKKPASPRQLAADLNLLDAFIRASRAASNSPVAASPIAAASPSISASTDSPVPFKKPRSASFSSPSTSASSSSQVENNFSEMDASASSASSSSDEPLKWSSFMPSTDEDEFLSDSLRQRFSR